MCLKYEMKILWNVRGLKENKSKKKKHATNLVKGDPTKMHTVNGK